MRQKQALFQGSEQNELAHFFGAVEKAREATAMIRSSWEKLSADCKEYRRRVEIQDRRDPQKFLRANWEHFAAFAGEIGADLTRLLMDYKAFLEAGGKVQDETETQTTDNAKETTTDGGWDSKKTACCEDLLRLATFIRSELATSEYWGGNLSLKSSFLQKQPFDGYPMREKTETEVTGSAAITVKFADAGTVAPFD